MNQRTFTSLAAFAAAMALVPAAAQAADPETKLMSRTTGPNVAANGFADQASISGDGRHVVFSSGADNLSNQDDNAYDNVFLRDRQTGLTTLISRGAGVPANSHSTYPSISANGRYVAYESTATNLTPDDADADADIFVFDRQTSTTALVSRASGFAGASAVGDVRRASISADGTRIAFLAQAENLSPIDSDSAQDAFVRDMATGVTHLVSMDGANTPADDNTNAVRISGDGSHVALQSGAGNLAGGGAPGGIPDIFVRNIDAQTTVLASRPTGFGPEVGSSDSVAPAISHNGRYVAFQSASEEFVDTDDDAATWRILRRDLLTGTTILISRADGLNGAPNHDNVDEPSISADGSAVAFATRDQFDAAATAGKMSIYVRRPVAGTTTLVSQSGGAGANDDSYRAAMSADGTAVAFASESTNLDPGAQSGLMQVFLRAAPYVAPEPQPEPPAQQPQPEAQPEQPQPQPQPEPQPGPVVDAPVLDAPAAGAATPKLRMKLVRLSATKAKVRVTCLAGDCRGTLRLQRVKTRKSLGRVTFALAAGAKTTVTVRLRRAAGKPRVRAVAAVRPSGGPAMVVARKLRLQRR